jgi:hypothetical protein
MKVLAAVFAITGIAISLLTLLHDLQRIRISLEAPQAAPSRLPPELHALAAIFDAVGWILLRGWLVGSLVFLGHLGFTIGLAPLLIERAVLWFDEH